MSNPLKIILFCLSLAVLCPGVGEAQAPPVLLPGTKAYADSLTSRATELERSIKKMQPGAGMYAARRELDMTMFRKTYEEFAYDEQLERVKLMIGDRKERARVRNDKFLYDFYSEFDQRADREIKAQKMRYQQWFAKEKSFKREFDRYLADGSAENLQRTKRMLELAINYATENNLASTVDYLRRYEGLADALLFDLNSDYNLEKLTSNEAAFNAVFAPMVGSDSLELIEEAGRLADNCFFYSKNSGGTVAPEFFQRKQSLVATAISDYLDRQGRNADLAKFSDIAIEARYDTVNPQGVYKWNAYIVVINQFEPTSASANVRRGEAILHADKVLADYIRVNKLGRLKSGEKLGYTFLIPFFFDGQKSDFYYDIRKQKWEYMVCYTRIVNKYYTEEIRKFLPPMVFKGAQPE